MAGRGSARAHFLIHMNESLTLLSKVIPQLVFIAAMSGVIGYMIRGAFAKSAPAKPAAAEKPQQDRAKNLEAALEKSKVAHKSLKSEHEALQSASVSQAIFATAAAERDAARVALESETKRLAASEADLKKSQDTIRQLNSRANEADKAQKDRSFALENELSKARQKLALLQDRPDDSAELQAEIERLRESVAVSSRYAGEMRKREATAVEALERAESRPAPAVSSQKIGPVVDSGRIAAAKAEVLRLVELNKQRDIPTTEDLPAPVAEELPPVSEEITEPIPTHKKVHTSGELFAMD